MAGPKLVFFGNERLATGVKTTAPTLQALIAADYDIVSVVSHYSGSTSRNNRDLEIAAVAEATGIPMLLPHKPTEVTDQLAAYGAEAAVLVAYGKIIPQSIIDIFPRGIINIHPSLLPLHRGPTPVESVILEGPTETGVSIMQLVREMDAGPVYGQTAYNLDGSESKSELAKRLLEAGSALLLELLPDILNGSLQPIPQDEARATYDGLISKKQSWLDFNKPARQLEREVRAYLAWPQSRTEFSRKEVVVTAASVIDGQGEPGSVWRDGKRFGFYTTDGILIIDRLKPSGKQEMSAEAFLAGYQSLLG